MPDPSLVNLQNFCNECNVSNSSLAKTEVVRRHPECQTILQYVYDKTIYKYYIKSSKVKKLKSKLDPAPTSEASMISLLKKFNDKELTGNAAVRAVLAFIADNHEYEDLIYNIIDRNLKTRTDVKLINKIYPGLISQFEVALANSLEEYDPKQTKINFTKDIWVASRKLDGCRCLSKIFTPDNIRIYSRNGEEFHTLQKIKDALRALNISNVVFDGEICIVGAQGNENYQQIMKVIRKKDYTIEHPKYKIFDAIAMADFDAMEGTRTLIDRQVDLANYIQICPSNFLDQVTQIRVTSWEHLNRLRQEALDNGWEGLILRKADIGYEGTRNNNMLKLKYFKDTEFEIVNTEMGPIRYIAYDSNGKAFEKEEEMLSAIMFQYTPNDIVRCGSGFSLEERKHYYKHPEELIGKQATIKYFEATENQTGGKSVRFPTLKHVWKEGDTREDEE